MSNETVRIRYYIRTDKVGSKCSDVLEVDGEEWASMSEDEREELMKEAAFNHMEWGYRVVEENHDND